MADWTWQPAIGDDIAKKGTRLALTLSVAAVGCVVAGILLGNARALVVIALMLATIVWLGRSNTKQLESLRVSVDGGIATFADSRRTTTVDLRTVERVAVSSRGDYQARQRWAIEAIGPGSAVEHRIGNVEQYWSLDEDQIDELRRGLQHYHDWYRTNAAPQQPVVAAAAADPAITAPVAAGAGAGFEWRIPLQENADRNRRRIGAFTLAVAGALAAAGVVSAWPDALGVILSLTVLPSVAFLIGGGLWFAYVPVRRFRLTAEDGVLFVHPVFGSKPPRQVQLAGATDVVVDTSTSYVATGSNSNTRTTTTYINITHPAAPEGGRINLPSGPGSAMGVEQRLLLESQLKKLAGLA